ncbi:MAG: HopJ type III effector protein, partial [Methylococcales bacterium]|nr:HopJ type III effector protein [Methylococcales bacterium]
MSLENFLQKIKNNETISFNETIKIITENYNYTPAEFSNGLSASKVINTAGSNEGSCKIFSFAQLNQLSAEHTLSLFGDYYRQDVLQNPNGNDHQNIRHFMVDGWAGIQFHQA